MASTPDEIIDAALKLSESDRWAIVSRLLDTLSDEMPGVAEDDDGLLEELKRRAKDTGSMVPIAELWNQD